MSTPTSELTTAAFWQYSTGVYADPVVAARCLQLQDSAGVNVNMLLLLCWCLTHGRLLTLKQWLTLKAAIAHSEQQLQRHRQQRRAAKPQHDAASQTHTAYAELKQQELALEAEQQAELVTAFNNMRIDSADIAGINASVVAFIHAYSLRENAAAMTDLRQLIKDVV